MVALVATLYSGIEYFVRNGRRVLEAFGAGSLRAMTALSRPRGARLPGRRGAAAMIQSVLAWLAGLRPAPPSGRVPGRGRAGRPLSVGSATRLRFDTEILNLLPKDDPVVTTFRSTVEVEDFGSLDYLLVLVRLPPDVPLDPYLSFVEELGASMEALEEIDYVDYTLDVEETGRDVLRPRVRLSRRGGAARRWRAG